MREAIRRARNVVLRRWERWIKKRSPKAKSVELDQRRIFIFPTGYGFFYLLTAALLFVAGINYENSLILNLSFFLLSLFLVAIFRTFTNLSGLTLVAGATKEAFMGGRAWFQVSLERKSSRTFESLEVIWDDRSTGLIDVTENSKHSVEMTLEAKQRGWYEPGRLKIQSTFPLGLLRTWSWVHLDMAALVYPKPIQCEYKDIESDGDKGGSLAIVTGREEFDSLKHYQVGDSLRNVAWKKYAATQIMMTKTFYALAGDSSWLKWSQITAVDCESKLSMLCYLVVKYTEENRVFGLSLPSGDITPSAGREHELECLRKLALFCVPEAIE